MVLSWWRDRCEDNGGRDENGVGREAAASSISAPKATLPGSPCFTYLKSPVVVQRRYGEKTGLLPIHR